MTVRTKRHAAFLALPDRVAAVAALVAHPEVVVGPVVADLAPFVAGALVGPVGEGAGGHGLLASRS